MDRLSPEQLRDLAEIFRQWHDRDWVFQSFMSANPDLDERNQNPEWMPEFLRHVARGREGGFFNG